MDFHKQNQPTTPSIAVVGNGLSALASVAALAKVGRSCDLIGDLTKDSHGPSLVLNDISETLLGILFPDISLQDYGYRLTHRWVKWGASHSPMKVSQPALALSSNTLLTLLRQSQVVRGSKIHPIDHHHPPDAATMSKLLRPYQWVIHANTATLPPEVNWSILGGGQRIMVATEGESVSANDSCCYIESLADSWLFSAPLFERRRIIQTCIPYASTTPQQALLESLYESRGIGSHVNNVNSIRCFPCAPYIRQPLCGIGWFLVGEAAIKLDPVSGEGTPFALRSAMLMAAVLDGILSDRLPLEAGLQHYCSRLTYSFISHLQGCTRFYEEAFGFRENWSSELHSMHHILNILYPQFSQILHDIQLYQLVDFRLVQS
ncbi:hypothetical protein [Moorena sp. SIO3B2]|uniref:NAD(P)/FAD-dependent oxidoreductase n=2 Tax=unclassified Moorena TaxID=2683338 RepID=UPI0013CACF55|nr:hypothetical protein [Moorena sp. SIO3B2]NEP34978.1 hypothetical protein [Moorena sp. SIO3B2]